MSFITHRGFTSSLFLTILSCLLSLSGHFISSLLSSCWLPRLSPHSGHPSFPEGNSSFRIDATSSRKSGHCTSYFTLLCSPELAIWNTMLQWEEMAAIKPSPVTPPPRQQDSSADLTSWWANERKATAPNQRFFSIVQRWGPVSDEDEPTHNDEREIKQISVDFSLS